MAPKPTKFASDDPWAVLNWDYDKNDKTPDQVGHCSRFKFWFNCPDCRHSFDAQMANITLGRRCPYCCVPCKKFCPAETNCDHCISRSAFSVQYARDNWNLEKNKIDPREVARSSNLMFEFKCSDCSHLFESPMNRIAAGGMCPYCCPNASKFCPAEAGCNHCIGRSVYRIPYARDNWDLEKNQIDPREVPHASDAYYWFKCQVCYHSFESTMGNIAQGCTARIVL